jgi:hypothetical protein
MNNYSGAMQSWILAALRFFRLVNDEGVPNARLAKFVNATDEEKKDQLCQWLTQSYSHLFREGFDLKSMTARQLEEEFAAYKLSASTVDRCISFFTGAAKEAGIELSPHLKKTRKRKSKSNGGVSRQSARGAKPAKSQEEDAPVIPNGKQSIPIALGPGKTWDVVIDEKHTPEDVKRFLQIVGLVLGHES